MLLLVQQGNKNPFYHDGRCRAPNWVNTVVQQQNNVFSGFSFWLLAFNKSTRYYKFVFVFLLLPHVPTLGSFLVSSRFSSSFLSMCERYLLIFICACLYHRLVFSYDRGHANFVYFQVSLFQIHPFSCKFCFSLQLSIYRFLSTNPWFLIPELA